VEAQELDRRWRRCAHALLQARLTRERAHRSPHALPLADLAHWAVERGATPRDVLAECVLQPETACLGPREAVLEHLLAHGLSPGARVCACVSLPRAATRVALWNPAHRSRVNSGQCFNRGFDSGAPVEC